MIIASFAQPEKKMDTTTKCSSCCKWIMLKKLDKRQARTIRDAILEVTDDSFIAVKKLSDSVFFRMRIGNYRIIMDLQQSKMIIFVVRVDHKRRIYGYGF